MAGSEGEETLKAEKKEMSPETSSVKAKRATKST